jgi:hypothetical protein
LLPAGHESRGGAALARAGKIGLMVLAAQLMERVKKG